MKVRRGNVIFVITIGTTSYMQKGADPF